VTQRRRSLLTPIIKRLVAIIFVGVGGPVATEPKMQFSRAKKLSLVGSAQPLFVEMFGAI
jgi:hypothetical protein